MRKHCIYVVQSSDTKFSTQFSASKFTSPMDISLKTLKMKILKKKNDLKITNTIFFFQSIYSPIKNCIHTAELYQFSLFQTRKNRIGN